MNLNDDEKRMLGGKSGDTIRRAMELLVKIGDANGAEDMIDVSYAHILAIERTDLLYELVCELTEGVQVKIPTTTHAMLFSLEHIEKMSLPETVIEKAKKFIPRLEQLHKRLGAIPTNTCFPYFVHCLKLGEHIAFTDSQVVPFVNSWFGARTNMETPVSAIASAITGKTPRYGMHLPENRLGEVLVEIAPELEAEKFDYADYGALSFWAGKILVDGIPVIPVYSGLPPRTTHDNAKYMSLPHTYHSGVTMFHLAGITPEAPTAEAAFGGRRPKAKFIFGKKQIKEAYQELTSATEEKVNVVGLGCPHCTIQELVDITRLLGGRKIHKDTQLWVGTNEPTAAVAKRMGLLDAIGNAGGLVISDACTFTVPVAELGAPVIATNAAAPCRLVLGTTRGKTTVWFGKTADCINAAIKGKWEAN